MLMITDGLTDEDILRQASLLLANKTLFQIYEFVLKHYDVILNLGCLKNKGAVGIFIEEALRVITAPYRLNWSLKTSCNPDCGLLEIKILPMKILKSDFARLNPVSKEDTAITMLRPHILECFANLQKKLNILAFPVIIEKELMDSLLKTPFVLDLRTDPTISTDYLNMQNVFNKRGGNKAAIAGMGKESGATGEAIKAKTKGPGRSLPEQRTRAIYIKRKFMSAQYTKHVTQADRDLETFKNFQNQYVVISASATEALDALSRPTNLGAMTV